MGRARAILCACVFLLAGCGGGGGGGDDPLALLEGTWFGPAHLGTVTLVIDGSGTVTQFLRDGVDTGLTGSLQHVSGTYYEGQLSSAGDFRLFLDPTATYATYFAEIDIGALQKGASALPPGGFQLSDIAPGTYQGTNLTIDAQVTLVSTFAATTTIAADGSYAGSDTSGLTYGSPTGTMLTANPDSFVGPYEDSAHATTGFIDIFASPDLEFLAAASFPFMNTQTANASFLSAWKRQ